MLHKQFGGGNEIENCASQQKKNHIEWKYRELIFGWQKQ